MNSIISNNIVIEDYNLDLIHYCEQNLVLENPEYHVAEKMGRYTKNIERYISLYEKRENKLIIPFGELSSVWSYISNSPFLLDFSRLQPLSMRGSIKLYPYQKNAVETLKNAKSGILEAPCGSGKTQMGIALIKELGLKALWLTHTKDLLVQSMSRAKEYFDGDFGTITDGKVSIGADITFATVQTMTKLDLSKYEKEWNVVIVDEAHRVAGSPTKVMQFYKVVSSLKARYKYGLSATLHRADGLIKSTYALLGNIVHSIEEEAVGNKIIKASHLRVDTNLPYSEVCYDTDGTIDYAKLIEYIVSDDMRNQQIAENIVLRPLSHHLVLSHRVNHLRLIQSKIDTKGVKSAILHGSVSERQRLQILDDMKNGKLNCLLATYQLAKEGLDIPILDTLHFATPNKNKAIIKQSAGRIERNFEGKIQPLIYDYVDTEISYCERMYTSRRRILK